MKTLKQLHLKGKKVFIRCDFNVPLQNGIIKDTYRILAALPTIQYVLSQQPKQIILASHLGRPEPCTTHQRTGNGNTLAQYSLLPVAKELSKQLKQTVELHALIDAPIESKNKIILLENLRFYAGEQQGSLAFAKQLAKHADVYINDAFGTAHRKDASVYALAKLLPSAPGLLMENEIRYVHLNHEKPIVAIFGAAKISDKLPLLKKLLTKVDKVILGGGVVFTFMKAAGIETGKSLIEEDMLVSAKKLLDAYAHKLVFPTDFVVASPLVAKGKTKVLVKDLSVVSFDEIPKTKAAYDVGPKSVQLFSAVLASAKTVVWNGPLGMFETQPFDKSTLSIAKFLATRKKITTIIGGGDTASALRKTPYVKHMTHISTGGGASLSLLAGERLPGVVVLQR